MTMNSNQATPERIARIGPQWIKDHIARLEREVSYMAGRNKELQDQIDLASGSMNSTETNVRLQRDDIGIALPPGSVITFQDKFEVSPSANDPDGIDVELVAPGGLCIIPDVEGRIYVRRLT